MTRVLIDERAPRSCCVRIANWEILSTWWERPELQTKPFAICERVGSRVVVRAASPLALSDGVVVGMRKREAEARCSGIEILDSDPTIIARDFEKMARAVEALTPRLELEEPGKLSFPTLGPARYFGGDVALATRVHEALTPLLGEHLSWARVGVADGRYVAGLAARESRNNENRIFIVPPGDSATFLASFPVAALGDLPLAELLIRLGIRTLGDFANLPAPDVLARFGRDGLRRHEMAKGFDYLPADLSVPPLDLVECSELDPPVTRVDVAAFTAKAMADRLLSRLGELGLGCTRVRVEAETEHGEQLCRVWRHEGALTSAALAERVRWQLDGWLAANSPSANINIHDERALQDLSVLAECGLTGTDTTTGALVLLRLVPEEVVPGSGRQLGFWGGDAAADERVDRVLGRLQGMLGLDSVGTFVLQGGRTPLERVTFLPWGEAREPQRVTQSNDTTVVWPGQVPSPAPTRVFDPPRQAELLDHVGASLRVSGRGEINAEPSALHAKELPDGGGQVTNWCGPWLHDVRWWDRRSARRRALFQIVIKNAADGDVACLVSIERGRAKLDAIY